MSKITTSIAGKINKLGPGFITGAADDDPSGIATYSIAGAQFGYKLNWLSLFLIPMMISIQEMCGRIGMCSGMGLAAVIKRYHSKKLVFFSLGILTLANVINIGADLGIMAASIQMIAGFNFFFWLLVITLLVIFLEIFISYKSYVKYLRWLGLSLLAYVITALTVKQDWLSIARFTLIPHIEWNTPFFMTMVGFIGTTISPYLFFWQASEEVEEEIATGNIKEFNMKTHIVQKDVTRMDRDTMFGMIFSNVISAFIVLTTAATLNQHGITNIETPQQAALALKPLAGNFAYILFAFGIIGIGLQSVPILAGSVAYAFSDAFGLKEGLSKKYYQAKAFYGIIAVAIIIGALMNIVGINPIKALYYAAIINGVVSIPLIAIIIKLADDKRIVGQFVTSRTNKYLAWGTCLFVTFATLGILFNVVI